MKKLTILSFAVLGILLSNCKKKDSDPEVTGPTVVNGSFQALQDYFNQKTAQATQIFYLDASAGGVITTAEGTKITILPNSFADFSGNFITGQVELSFVEIFERTDMILMNKATAFKDELTGKTTPLVSGGEFYINVTKNGNSVELMEVIRVDLPTDNPVSNMQKFRKNMQDEFYMTWVFADTTIVNTSNPNGTQTYFNMNIYGFGWINCDYFYNNPNPKTKIKLNVPDQLKDSRAGVYVAFKGEKTMLSQLYYNVSTAFYEAENFPVGLDVYFIVIANDGSKLYYTIVEDQLKADHYINIDQLNAATEAELKVALDALL